MEPGVHTEKPLVSLVMSAYNEEPLVEAHLARCVEYLESLRERFLWEIILINDGSLDATGPVADRVAKSNSRIRVFHHPKNYGLGKGLQTGFEHSRGEYVITYDFDLSMSLDHIGKLLDKVTTSHATVVVASPMLPGGSLEGMPYYRKVLSRSANRFLAFCSPQKLSSLTCMVRAYEGDFIRSLNLRSEGMEIMPEILFKSMVLRERIEEIPAKLCWEKKGGANSGRKSKMRLVSHTFQTLFSGFLLKPFYFFILPGFCLFLFSLYPIFWMYVHFSHEYSQISATDSFLDRSSEALAKAYALHPHTFVVALFSVVISIQLVAFGFHSIQNKHYFEELFTLMTKLSRKLK